jgi:hypothetical protein
MVGLGGVEPPTSPLSGVRSSQLSYRPIDLRAPELKRADTAELSNEESMVYP